MSIYVRFSKARLWPNLIGIKQIRADFYQGQKIDGEIFMTLLNELARFLFEVVV
jgi:hypothetical protein